MCAELIQVNQEYENPLSFQPVGRTGERGPWKFFVSRYDLERRKLGSGKITFRKFNTRFHPSVIEKEKKTGISTWYMTKDELQLLESRKIEQSKNYGHSKTCLDFGESSEFILLKEVATFTSTNDLFAREMTSLIKMDKEIKKWYMDLANPPSGQDESADEAGKREEAVCEALALMDAEEQDLESQGILSENDGDDDWRFKKRAEENLSRAETADEVQQLLSNIPGEEQALQLVPFNSSSGHRSINAGSTGRSDDVVNEYRQRLKLQKESIIDSD